MNQIQFTYQDPRREGFTRSFVATLSDCPARFHLQKPDSKHWRYYLFHHNTSHHGPSVSKTSEDSEATATWP